MKPRHPSPKNLNVEILAEEIAGLNSIGIKEGSAITHALAGSIIINALGGNFWAKECTTFGEKQEFFRIKSDVKVVHLAHMLWLLKDIYGFEAFLEKNQLNEFESTYYECTAASWFVRSSAHVELVIPRQKRGSDFDVLVSEFNGTQKLNVEVKARRRHFDSAKQLKNFLNRHRSQLPPNENGAFFCKLAITHESIPQDELTSTTQKFLASTNRVGFVIYCWDCSPRENEIAHKYVAINECGDMGPIFEQNRAPTVPAYLEDVKDYMAKQDHQPN